MFYTYLRALLPLFFGFKMGMPITIISGQYSRSGRELHIGIASPDLVGSSLYGLCDQAKSSLSLWRKRTLSPPYFWLVDSYVASDRP